MESPPVRGTSSASPPNSSKNNNTSERSAAPSMTALDKTTSSSASLDSSLNRRRNTYAALPNVPSSKPLSSDAQGNGSGAVPRYTNTNRRNTTSGIDWHTPPVSVTNSLERANMATHAASEPRHTTAGRLPLASSSSTAGGGTALPPVAGSGSTPSSAPSSLSTRAVSAGLVRTNATITRSARLPLNSSTSPTSSAASTPPARRPPLGWMNGSNGNNSNNAGAAPPTAPPSGNTVPALPPSTASVAGKVERVSLTNGVVNKAGSNSTSTSPSASPATTAGQPSGPPPEAKTINTAIKTFNQRLLEEREKEKARLSRRSSRANSREASMSVLPVPSTQPPSAAPPPPLKTTAPPPAPAAAEPFVKRGSSDSAVVSRTPSSNARTPASSPAGTGTKTTPVNPPPVATTATTSNARTAQSPAASSARSPPRQLYLAPGKPTVPLTVSSSSDDSSGGSGRNSNSTGAQNKPQPQPSLATTKTTATTSRVSASPSQPRSVQNSTESGVVSSAPRMSLVEQGPRSHLPRTLPTTSTAAASPANKTSAQPTPVKAPQQTTSPAAATNLKPAMTTFTPPRTTTSTSGSQSARLELGKAPFSQSPPQPPSVRHSGSGTALQVSPRTASTNGSANRTPNGVNAVAAASLPSRYSDYNDDRTPTPPRAAPLSQAPASPVYSAVEVQAHTPPNSSTTSSRRGVPGLASVFGDTKKDANTVVTGGSAEGSLSLSSRNRSSVSASAPAPPPKKAAPPVLVKSHTLDDLDDAGEDAATPNAQDGGRSSAPGSARAATAAPQTEHGRGQRVSDNTSLDSADGAAGGSARGGARASPSKPQLALTQGGGAGGNKTSSSPRPQPAVTVPTSARTAAAAGAPPVTSSPLTALAVFSSTDEPRIVKSSPLTTNKVTPVKVTDAGEKKTAPLSNNAATAAAVPSPAASSTAKAHGNGIDGRNTAVSKPTAAATLAQPPSPTASPPHLNTGSIVTAARSAPQPSTSPPSHVTPAANNTHTPSPQRQQQQQRPGSALTRNGRYAMSRSRDGQAGPLAPDHDDHAVNTSGPQPVDANAEAATLHTYLKEEELNLSMSTFNSVGLSLAHSLNLRVLNLKGSTIASEGLRGLANIATLRSICVSHMRSLTTLIPLVTPTTPGARCSIEEIDAQFSSVGNDGIRDLEKVRRLRRLDLSMTPISDVTCLGASISLQDLYLTGTRVDSAGVAGLERVPTLTTLNIARTKVTSVCQLAKSRSLQTFIFYSCQVNDAGFAGVAEMPRLATLDVSTTKIEDLSVLRTSRSLKSVKAQWLSLKNCQDIIQERRSQMDAAPPGDSMEWRDTEAGFAGLAAIATLETLDLSFNTLRSVHSLCRSKSLKHLYLKRTRVENSGIGSIAQLGATLETLVITNLTDSLDDEDDEHEFEPNASGLLSLIGDIHLLQHLTLLDLSYTDVFDLRLLQNITTLKELVIVETLVTVDGLRGIEKIPSLEVLDVSQTSILSLQFLVGGAPKLRKILARSNRNTCGFVLGQVHKLPALEHLDLSDSVVEDMESVPKKLWRLKELVWRWGERRDNKGLAPSLECWVTSPRLVGLREMPCLTLLDLSSSRVHDLSFLAGAPYLKEVHLRLCKLLRNATVQDLGSLVSLEVLQLSDNTHITDVTFLRGCRKLRELHLNNTRVTTSGLEGVLNLPELKVLNIANTRAEDETMNGGRAAERNRMLEDSTMRDCSAVLDNAATPAQYRVPRRRRVSFVANDGGDTLSKAS